MVTEVCGRGEQTGKHSMSDFPTQWDDGTQGTRVARENGPRLATPMVYL